MKTIYVLIHDKDKTLKLKIYTKENKEEFKKWNEQGWGVYFSANQFRDRTRTKAECVKLRYVYADLDVAKQNDGQSQEDIDAKKDAVIMALYQKCVPTCVINTKNGIQPLWQLKEGDPRRIEEYENIIRGIIRWSLEFGCKGDAVQDAARILRMPGYFHQKGEPYLCEARYSTEEKYTMEELREHFYYEPPKVEIKKTTYSPNKITQAIDDLDFKELILRAFGSTGRNAEFDLTGRLILDGRLTGTFQGRKDDRAYLASASHEPFKGNRITAVADILQVTNKEAYKWIIDEYGFNFTELEKKKIVEKQLKTISTPKGSSFERREKRYTWGTTNLDHTIVILKRGNLAVIGAKRNMGKTTFTFDMACKNAKLGHKVLYISLEMEKESILEALARNYAGITVEEEYAYKIPENKLQKMKERIKEIESIETLNFEGIRRGELIVWDTVKAIMEKTPADLVFIDNLDLISADLREEELTKQKRIMNNLMSFTTEKNVPVVLIHHYRKGYKGAQGMDELAGSGKIADDADILINLSRRSIEESIKDDVGFPESNKTVVWVQKGRGYVDKLVNIYFVEGSFYDSKDIPADAYHRGEIDLFFNKSQAKVNN